MLKTITRGLCAMASAALLLGTVCPRPAFADEKTEQIMPESNGNSLRLWYTSPARSWTSEALVIGNGTTGGILFGGCSRDQIHFNEKTLWSGGPGSVENYDGGNRDEAVTQDQLESIRQQADDHSEYVFPLDTGGLDDVMGDGEGMGMYQDFGDLYLDFYETGIDDSGVENYVRDLDLTTAVSSVNFDFDGVHYSREYFASYPDGVLVSHLSASEKGSLSFDAYTEEAYGLSVTPESKDGRITLAGTVDDNGMKCEMQAQILCVGGTIEDLEDGSVHVSNADEATIILATGTDYKNEWPDYRGEDPHEAVSQKVDAASQKSYEELKSTHTADYQNLFDRVSIDLGGTCPEIPTDQLMEQYRQGNTSQAAEELVYQFGRYLTIAASRENDPLPSNLCGIWLVGGAESYWGGDFHFNVNVQMNYWPAYQTNLAECGSVFTDYLYSLVEPGRVTAAMSAGVPTEAGTPVGEGNGFLVNTQNNPFGLTAPFGEQEYGWNICGSSWALQNAWDEYLFTQDEQLLKEKIYPMLKEQAHFWDQFLWHSEEQDRLVVGPSVSAEHGPTVNGTTYDQSLVWELYKMAIEASEILGVDAEERETWKQNQDQLNPILIGEEGQVKEWYEETTLGYGQAGDLEEEAVPNFGAGGSANGGAVHRHTSQLIGLYPGTLINQDTPEWMDAAVISLQQRNMGGTGWSKAHKINMYARTGRAEDTYSLVQAMMSGNEKGILNNLLDSHPPFQIDGNYGLTAGMNEMLLQSQAGYTEFLPALPEAWSEGSLSGVVARGNFVIDMKWSGQKADSFDITSRSGNVFTGEYENLADYSITKSDGTAVEVTKLSDNRISFETEEGETYHIDFNQGDGRLKDQIETARNLVSAMSDPRLEMAASVLLESISQAQAIVDTGNVDEYYSGRMALKQACDKALAAMNLTDQMDQAALCVENHPFPQEWNTYQNIVKAIDESVNEAQAKLNDRNAQKEDYVRIQNKIANICAELEGLQERLTLSFTPDPGLCATGKTVSIISEFNDLTIRYTTDKNDPIWFSPVYEGPVSVTDGGLNLKAALYCGKQKMSDVYEGFWSGDLGENLAPKASKVTADSCFSSDFDGSFAVDDSMETAWWTEQGVESALLELEYDEPVSISSMAIYQMCYPGICDIQKLSLEYMQDGQWVSALSDETMDNKQNKKFFFEPFQAQSIRLNLSEATNPYIFEVQLFGAKETASEPADKTALEQALAGAKEAVDNGEAEDTLPEILQRFQEVYDYANQVNDNPSSDQNTVNQTAQELIKQTERLSIKSVDTTELLSLLSIAERKDLSLYTTSSASVLEQAMAAARRFISQTEQSQDENERLTALLRNAIDGLQEKASEASLEALRERVNAAKAMTQTSPELEALIARAEALLADPDNAPAEEVSVVLFDLSMEMRALEDARTSKLREDLEATIEEATVILEEQTNNVRPGQIEALKAAIENGKSVLDNPESSDEELQDAMNQISAAVHELWQIVSKTELNRLIEMAGSLNESDYSEETWNALQQALDAARETVANDDATLAQVTDAIASLASAIASLKTPLVLDFSALQYEVDLAGRILDHADDYVPDSIKGLDALLEQGKEVLNNAQTQEEIDAAIAALRQARLNARTKADKKNLENLLAQADALKLEDYQEEGLSRFRQAYSRARGVYDNPGATQEEVDAAVKELTDAMEALKPVNGTDKSEDKIENKTPSSDKTDKVSAIASASNSKQNKSSAGKPSTSKSVKTAAMTGGLLTAMMAAAGAGGLMVLGKRRKH